MAAGDPSARYALGSVLNHVLMHQTVIGEEAIKQLAEAGDTPDVIVGCTGGGSNFGGLAFPFLREKLAGRINPVIRAVEPAACPSFTRGVYAYDFGDTAGMTPLLKMHTLGHEFIPDPIHAGGLRYHGMSPLLSHIYELGLIEAVAKPQSECFAAGLRFARTEGIVPAPEPTHAVAACIEEALRCKETGEEKVILTALCGHGLLDLPAYASYLAGEIRDLELGDQAIEEALAGLPAGPSRGASAAAGAVSSGASLGAAAGLGGHLVVAPHGRALPVAGVDRVVLAGPGGADLPEPPVRGAGPAVLVQQPLAGRAVHRDAVGARAAGDLLVPDADGELPADADRGGGLVDEHDGRGRASPRSAASAGTAVTASGAAARASAVISRGIELSRRMPHSGR